MPKDACATERIEEKQELPVTERVEEQQELSATERDEEKQELSVTECDEEKQELPVRERIEKKQELLATECGEEKQESFTETKIYTTTSGVEPVTALLLRRGVSGAVVEDVADIRAIAEGKERSDWDYIDPALFPQEGTAEEAVVTFYTPDDAEGRAFLDSVKIDLMKLKNDELCGAYGTGVDFGRMYAESVPLSDDWKHRWKEGFKPFRVTERFIVCPPWDIPYDASCLSDEVRDGDRDGKIIIIDPGMAFGTGSHETTSMCVRALEDTVRPGVAVLDIGTGSGILSVVAVLLGAERVSAVEIDADAVRAARLNFERNGVADRIELTEGDIRNIPISECDAETQEDAGRYDAVVANLTSGLIRMILPAVALYMKKSGRLILSGLLDREESAMRQALSAAGFSVERVAAKGEWLMMIASHSGEAACGTEQGCGDSVSPEIPPTA